MSSACPECLTRARLIEAIAGRIEILARGRRPEARPLLDLSNDELLEVANVAEEDREGVLATAAKDGLRDADAPVEGGSLCRHQDHYPAALRDLADPPSALFYTGPLERLERRAGDVLIAVVGARRPSLQGQQAALLLGRGLAAAGVTVVSGMAFGIDAACHRGALKADGGPIAVLASGADRASPYGNRSLYGEIRARGSVVSEMPWGATPRRWLFPARNRIMAALSEMTIVVEAADRSGSLITSDFAEQLGRPVGALPGMPGARITEGNNRLLREGCVPVRYAQDVLDELSKVGWLPARDPDAARRPIEGDEALNLLLDAVEVGETLDAMARRSGLAARDLRSALARLEGAGLIRRAGLGQYVANTIG